MNKINSIVEAEKEHEEPSVTLNHDLLLKLFQFVRANKDEKLSTLFSNITRLKKQHTLLTLHELNEILGHDAEDVEKPKKHTEESSFRHKGAKLKAIKTFLATGSRGPYGDTKFEQIEALFDGLRKQYGSIDVVESEARDGEYEIVTSAKPTTLIHALCSSDRESFGKDYLLKDTRLYEDKTVSYVLCDPLNTQTVNIWVGHQRIDGLFPIDVNWS